MGDPRAAAAQSRIRLPGLTPLAATVASDMLARKDIDEAHMMMPAALPEPDDMAIALSPSGRTAAVINAVEPARRNGARTIAGTKDPDSPLARSVEFCLVLQGAEHRAAGRKRPCARRAAKPALYALRCGRTAPPHFPRPDPGALRKRRPPETPNPRPR